MNKLEKHILIILQNFAKDNNISNGLRVKIWFENWISEHPNEQLLINYDNIDLKNSILDVRQRAIEWWEYLTEIELINLQVKYYPYAGTPENLTGYQIQKIWEKEIINK